MYFLVSSGFVYDVCQVCLMLYAVVGRLSLFFFFFKQKTAYEMRISDWSSDVCSSDLLDDVHGRHRQTGAIDHAADVAFERHVVEVVQIGRASCRERVCQYV